jgi:hypothetical protein
MKLLPLAIVSLILAIIIGVSYVQKWAGKDGEQ